MTLPRVRLYAQICVLKVRLLFLEAIAGALIGCALLWRAIKVAFYRKDE